MAPKRETYKDIEEGGRKWRIKKWPADLSDYWLNKLLMGSLRSAPNTSDDMIQAIVASNLSALNKTDFFDFQKDCLSVCSELMVMGDNSTVAEVPVLRVDGTFNVPDMEVKTLMALRMNAFVFSVQDPFFGASESGESGQPSPDSKS